MHSLSTKMISGTTDLMEKYRLGIASRPRFNGMRNTYQHLPINKQLCVVLGWAYRSELTWSEGNQEAGILSYTILHLIDEQRLVTM